jgi:hypothetical protein
MGAYMSFWYSGLNRTICDVFEEMRKCCKTGNYSYLPGLIEEAQSMANRMEAALEDVKDVRNMRADKKKLKEELQKLKKEKEKLESK